jgi:drug/metabolite transporter (DMT)-like permease
VRPTAKAQLQIHFCVLLWGFTSILGKQITLPAIALVWWRMVVAVAALTLVPRVWRGVHGMSGRLALAYAGVGVLLALHWVTFFGAIKLANASVAATCIALAPVSLAVIEPWVGRRRFDPREVFMGIAVAPGVALVVGGVPTTMRLGVLVGTSSALLVALFGALNKRLVRRADSLTVSWLELGAGTVFLTGLAPLLPHAGASFPVPSRRDATLLLTLALGCTVLPFAVYLAALRQLPAFGVQLTINLEPVYTIVLAILLLGEQHELGSSFYLGVAIILGVLFAYPALTRRTRS